jgi:hypothetical protein
MQRLLFGMVFLLLGMQVAGAQACLAHCAEPSSTYCLFLRGTQSNVSAGVSTLYEFIGALPANGSRTLQKPQLQSFFGIQGSDDVCKRSDTTLSRTDIANDGPGYCLLTTTLANIPSAKTIKGSIGIPPNLRLKVEFAPVIHFSIGAYDGPLMLYLEDALLQSEWGGHVSDIWLSLDRAVIKTENGCVRYQFK